MAYQSINSQDVNQLMERNFGTKPVVMMHLNSAKNASHSLKLAILDKNPLKIVQEAQNMINSIDQLHAFLAPDEIVVGNAPKSPSEKKS